MLFVNDFDNAWGLLHQVQREMLRAASLVESQAAVRGGELTDEGEAYGLTIDLPGVSENELEVRFHEDLLTITAARKTTTPEGYHQRLSERGSYEFHRSYQVPARVNAEGISAQLKNGVLQVRLEKTAEVQPRRIAVRMQ